jgi:hypothetical protein
LKRFWLSPPLVFIAVALSGALFGPISSVSAQSLLGRSGGLATGSAIPGGPGSPKPTVESVSREAQRAIRACDDSAALTCVTNELTKYAEALQEIAQERRESAAGPQGRRNGCASRSRKLPGCRG